MFVPATERSAHERSLHFHACVSTAGGDPEEQGTLMTVSHDTEIAGSRALIVVGLDPTETPSVAR